MFEQISYPFTTYFKKTQTYIICGFVFRFVKLFVSCQAYQNITGIIYENGSFYGILNGSNKINIPKQMSRDHR